MFHFISAREPNVSKKENLKYPVDISDNLTHFSAQFVSEKKKSIANGHTNFNSTQQRANVNPNRENNVLLTPGWQKDCNVKIT